MNNNRKIKQAVIWHIVLFSLVFSMDALSIRFKLVQVPLFEQDNWLEFLGLVFVLIFVPCLFTLYWHNYNSNRYELKGIVIILAGTFAQIYTYTPKRDLISVFISSGLYMLTFGVILFLDMDRWYLLSRALLDSDMNLDSPEKSDETCSNIAELPLTRTEGVTFPVQDRKKKAKKNV